MNKQELQDKIGFLFHNGSPIGLELYLILETNNGPEIKRADLGVGTLPNEVKDGFLTYLQGRTFENPDAEVKELSELDPKPTTIHHYNLEGLPDDLEIIKAPLNAEITPTFNFTTDNLDQVEAFLIKLSSVDNQVVLYKKHYRLNLLKQANVFYFIKDNERFAKPTEGILRFSFTFDFLLAENEIFVYDVKCLEREFRFDRILINNAQTKLTAIAGLNLVENFDELQQFANDKRGAKRVLKIRSDSKVLTLGFDVIKAFVLGHEYLKRRLKFNATGSQFKFHTQVSKVYFIDLLNDNYLNSELTSTLYITQSKNEMASEVGDDEDDSEE